jgi:IS30 family transposase
MQLIDWMKRENVTCEQIAAGLGRDTSTISRLIPKPGKKQTRRPSIELAAEIASFTNGAVTANDFVDGDGSHSPLSSDTPHEVTP